MIIETIVKNLEDGLGIMEEALKSGNQRRGDVGQGAYEGAVMSAEIGGFNISTYKNRGRELIEQARTAGIIIKGEK